jgi:hypothetical protein
MKRTSILIVFSFIIPTFVYFVTGISAILLCGMIFLLVLISVMTHQPMMQDWMPTIEELRKEDEYREWRLEDEYVDSGKGQELYKETLEELLTLVDKKIEVKIFSTSSSIWPMATIRGLLRLAYDVSGSTDEVLFFTIDKPGNGFYLNERTFLSSKTQIRKDLIYKDFRIVGPNGETWLISKSSSDSNLEEQQNRNSHDI